ncbi:MAG: lipoyl synthase [Alistipes sp.]|nr:lipoyl synthase [Alistipes sp.]
MPKCHEEVTRHKKPDWLKIKLHNSDEFGEVARIVQQHGLHTICSSGRCPNQAECWSRRTATFMILGEICTRSCKFCATATGKPLPPDPDEPQQLARSIALMGLKHCVITSVDRDDLPDGGVHVWADTVRAVREANPHTSIELLIPDFDARPELLDVVIASAPDIIGHNIETVKRLTPQVRSRARYEVSMQSLQYLAQAGCRTKSGLMVGLGETSEEVLQTIDDLVAQGVRILTIGQYLRPSLKHFPVAEYITPQQFEVYKQEALQRGMAYVESGPMVRSSYKAERAMACCNAQTHNPK